MREIAITGYDTVVKIPRVIARLTATVTGRPYGMEMANWLEDNIGPGKPGIMTEKEMIPDYHFWYSQVYFGYIQYHFRREQDATMFSLKFSS